MTKFMHAFKRVVQLWPLASTWEQVKLALWLCL
jgi:hypothetical protein